MEDRTVSSYLDNALPEEEEEEEEEEDREGEEMLECSDILLAGWESVWSTGAPQEQT